MTTLSRSAFEEVLQAEEKRLRAEAARRYELNSPLRISLPLRPPIIDRDPGDEDPPFRFRWVRPSLWGPRTIERELAPVHFFTGHDPGDEDRS